MNVRFVVIDTETGGIDSKTDALLQIGAVGTDLESGFSALERFEVDVKPEEGLNVTDSALKVNGIKRTDLNLGNLELDALHLFRSFVGQYSNRSSSHQNGPPVIIGWNIHFDLAFLRVAYRRQGLKWKFEDYRSLDVRHLWAYYNLVGH